jgi:hypothetical protein
MQTDKDQRPDFFYVGGLTAFLLAGVILRRDRVMYLAIGGRSQLFRDRRLLDIPSRTAVFGLGVWRWPPRIIAVGPSSGVSY